MHEQTHDGGKTVYHQGDLNNRLFFVNQGQLKTVHQSEDKEILIKSLTEGSIFGEDSFFSINVCTTSVVTMTAEQATAKGQAAQPTNRHTTAMLTRCHDVFAAQVW